MATHCFGRRCRTDGARDSKPKGIRPIVVAADSGQQITALQSKKMAFRNIEFRFSAQKKAGSVAAGVTDADPMERVAQAGFKGPIVPLTMASKEVIASRSELSPSP